MSIPCECPSRRLFFEISQTKDLTHTGNKSKPQILDLERLSPFFKELLRMHMLHKNYKLKSDESKLPTLSEPKDFQSNFAFFQDAGLNAAEILKRCLDRTLDAPTLKNSDTISAPKESKPGLYEGEFLASARKVAFYNFFKFHDLLLEPLSLEQELVFASNLTNNENLLGPIQPNRESALDVGNSCFESDILVGILMRHLKNTNEQFPDLENYVLRFGLQSAVTHLLESETLKSFFPMLECNLQQEPESWKNTAFVNYLNKTCPSLPVLEEQILRQDFVFDPTNLATLRTQMYQMGSLFRHLTTPTKIRRVRRLALAMFEKIVISGAFASIFGNIKLDSSDPESVERFKLVALIAALFRFEENFEAYSFIFQALGIANTQFTVALGTFLEFWVRKLAEGFFEEYDYLLVLLAIVAESLPDFQAYIFLEPMLRRALSFFVDLSSADMNKLKASTTVAMRMALLLSTIKFNKINPALFPVIQELVLGLMSTFKEPLFRPCIKVLTRMMDFHQDANTLYVIDLCFDISKDSVDFTRDFLVYLLNVARKQKTMLYLLLSKPDFPRFLLANISCRLNSPLVRRVLDAVLNTAAHWLFQDGFLPALLIKLVEQRDFHLSQAYAGLLVRMARTSPLFLAYLGRFRLIPTFLRLLHRNILLAVDFDIAASNTGQNQETNNTFKSVDALEILNNHASKPILPSNINTLDSTKLTSISEQLSSEIGASLGHGFFQRIFNMPKFLEIKLPSKKDLLDTQILTGSQTSHTPGNSLLPIPPDLRLLTACKKTLANSIHLLRANHLKIPNSTLPTIHLPGRIFTGTFLLSEFLTTYFLNNAPEPGFQDLLGNYLLDTQLTLLLSDLISLFISFEPLLKSTLNFFAADPQPNPGIMPPNAVNIGLDKGEVNSPRDVSLDFRLHLNFILKTVHRSMTFYKGDKSPEWFFETKRHYERLFGYLSRTTAVKQMNAFQCKELIIKVFLEDNFPFENHFRMDAAVDHEKLLNRIIAEICQEFGFNDQFEIGIFKSYFLSYRLGADAILVFLGLRDIFD